MKKVLILACLLFGLNSFAQISYVRGYPMVIIDCGDGSSETHCGPDKESFCYITTQGPCELIRVEAFTRNTSEPYPFDPNLFYCEEILNPSENKYIFNGIRNEEPNC